VTHEKSFVNRISENIGDGKGCDYQEDERRGVWILGGMGLASRKKKTKDQRYTDAKAASPTCGGLINGSTVRSQRTPRND
jgi:hypothetical protein